MLSIIIPTLNEEKYLPLLIKLIKSQTYKDYEIIVADGGSKDKTIKIAKAYGCKIAAGGSAAKGRNEGVKAAKGEIFLFLDADIVNLAPQFLEKLLEGFEKRNLDVASFSIYPQGNKFDKLAYGLYNFWVKLSQNFLPHATEAVLIRKEIHQKIGGFDEEIKIGEDHDYARRGAKFGKFGFLEIPPVLSSSRRFDRDGRLKTYLKFLGAGAYMLFFGPVKLNIFKYRFDHYLPPVFPHKNVRGLKNKKKEL